MDYDCRKVHNSEENSEIRHTESLLLSIVISCLIYDLNKIKLIFLQHIEWIRDKKCSYN